MQHTEKVRDIRPNHTLCFLTRGNDVLMLKRVKQPHCGLWNGVGGKIETGESPLASCLREVSEETGFCLTTARFGGLLSWQQEDRTCGSIYLYTAPAPTDQPSASSEGILKWHPKEWVFSSSEVVQNIHIFGPPVLSHTHPKEYYFEYRHQTLTNFKVRPLPQWVNPVINVLQI